MDLAIAIRIGSQNSTLPLVKGTIESIEEKIGKCSYRFILSLDPQIRREVKDYIYQKRKENPERFHILHEKTVFWSEFINEALEAASDCEYFIEAHDDIKILTSDWFPKTKQILDSLKEPVAWISFHSMAYLAGDWSPSTRPGFHKDFLYEKAWEKRKLFQFHTLPDEWWKPPFWRELPSLIQQRFLSKISPSLELFHYPEVKMRKEYQALLDIPVGPVKCHTAWNTFTLIKMDVLRELGPCEHWQTYNALLVDEDWGLRALKRGYWNIWIPEIKFWHVRPPIGGDRSQYQIAKDAERVHNLFREKWGFNPRPDEEELVQIQKIHKQNLIPWSIGKNSYEWEYIK